MFIGQYSCTLDDKNSLQVPVQLRAELTDRAVITQGFDRNLLVLPAEAFQDISRLAMTLNIADPLARGLLRMLLGNASQAEIKPSGEISLPAALKTFAGLGTEIVLVGQGKYLEVWSQAAWQQQQLYLQDAESNSVRFTSMNLAER